MLHGSWGFQAVFRSSADHFSHIPIIPFHRTWPKTEMLLAAALNLFFSGGNFLLQFFKPVQHDVDLRRCRLLLLGGLEHQEALAIG
jgi:hypothetical protein